MAIYRWEWLNSDGSERKVEINTTRGIETARERALSFFSGDDIAQDMIKNTQPVIIN